MQWGTFTLTHIATLILAVGILVALYFVLRKAPQKEQIAVLGVLSFSGIGAIIYNLLAWGAPLAYLPLHLCSINAMLLPVAVFTRNKTLGNLLLLWCLGALAAVVLNYEMAETELFGAAFNVYFFPHIMEFGIPLLMVKLGLVKKDPKCIASTMVISMGIYTVVHFLNLLINNYCIAIGDAYRANYMFSLGPTNPLVALFHKVIPHAYWYMYMVLPIVFVYLLLVYTPDLIRSYQRKKTAITK